MSTSKYKVDCGGSLKCEFSLRLMIICKVCCCNLLKPKWCRTVRVFKTVSLNRQMRVSISELCRSDSSITDRANTEHLVCVFKKWLLTFVTFIIGKLVSICGYRHFIWVKGDLLGSLRNWNPILSTIPAWRGSLVTAFPGEGWRNCAGTSMASQAGIVLWQHCGAGLCGKDARATVPARFVCGQLPFWVRNQQAILEVTRRGVSLRVPIMSGGWSPSSSSQMLLWHLAHV